MGPSGILPVMIMKTKSRKYLPLEEFGMSVQDINMASIDMTTKNGIISEANSYYSKAATGGILLRKVVLRNFKNFAETCNFIKTETLAQVLSCEFWEISKKCLRNF